MLKKTIAYTDFNEEEQVEDFYFNLSKTELTELEVSVSGGYSGMLKEIAASENPAMILSTFKKIVLASVGIKSEDGKHFTKSDEIAANFVASAAFDALFMSLINDTDKLSTFVQGILPKDVAGDFDSEMKKNQIVEAMKADAETKRAISAEADVAKPEGTSAPYSD